MVLDATTQSSSHQVPARLTLSLLRPKIFPPSLQEDQAGSLCWIFLKLIEKLPPPLSLEIVQGLGRKIEEWLRVNINCSSSANIMTCFAATVIAKSILISNQQQHHQQDAETSLDCDLWLRRVSNANAGSQPAPTAISVALGIPRLLLMLLTKRQFVLAEKALKCCCGGGNISGGSTELVPLIPCLPHPFSPLVSQMIVLESLASSLLLLSSVASAGLTGTDDVPAKIVAVIILIRSLMNQAPPSSPLTPTVNALVSSMSSRCDFVESSLQRLQEQQERKEQEQHQSHSTSTPWWSYLFVRTALPSARFCDVDVSMNPECVVYR
jgi:hypothetical protein